MKHLVRQISKVLSMALFSAVIIFTGCENNDPMSPVSMPMANRDNGQSASAAISLNKPNRNGTSGTTQNIYPMSGSQYSYFHAKRNLYKRVYFDLEPSKSSVEFFDGSLTPPPGHPGESRC